MHNDCPSDAEVFDEVSALRAEIERLRAERRWIPVTERMPEISEQHPTARVIGLSSLGRANEVEWHMNVYAKTEKGRLPRWKWRGMNCFWEVTHWMPLPEPPGDGEVGQ